MMDMMDRAMLEMELREEMELYNLLWNTVPGPASIPTEAGSRMECRPTPREFSSNH
jgi:hypothetical protein